jgi:hypothetical protein
LIELFLVLAIVLHVSVCLTNATLDLEPSSNVSRR